MEKEIEIPEKFKKIVEEIEKMSVLDLAKLVKILEEKFGVQAVAPMAFAQMPQMQNATETQQVTSQQEEKSVFNIILKSVGQKKIEVIKIVRDLTGKGLKESKDLVDAAEKEPQVIKENVKKEEAEQIKQKFQEAGATIELK
ncbi:MAG: 50S ribosomal protein L7/L12 [Minisyncoccia bacterium]